MEFSEDITNDKPLGKELCNQQNHTVANFSGNMAQNIMQETLETFKDEPTNQAMDLNHKDEQTNQAMDLNHNPIEVIDKGKIASMIVEKMLQDVEKHFKVKEQEAKEFEDDISTKGVDDLNTYDEQSWEVELNQMQNLHAVHQYSSNMACNILRDVMHGFKTTEEKFEDAVDFVVRDNVQGWLKYAKFAPPPVYEYGKVRSTERSVGTSFRFPSRIGKTKRPPYWLYLLRTGIRKMKDPQNWQYFWRTFATPRCVLKILVLFFIVMSCFMFPGAFYECICASVDSLRDTFLNSNPVAWTVMLALAVAFHFYLHDA